MEAQKSPAQTNTLACERFLRLCDLTERGRRSKRDLNSLLIRRIWDEMTAFVRMEKIDQKTAQTGRQLVAGRPRFLKSHSLRKHSQASVMILKVKYKF